MSKSGYSGTPLEKKLGIKHGFIVKFIHAPIGYFNLFTDLPSDLKNIPESSVKKDFIHFFVKSLNELEKEITHLKLEIKQDGIIWISWPKKASKMETDLDGNKVREIGLKSGLVDIKVCAVDETWSGLKFVIPVKERNIE